MHTAATLAVVWILPLSLAGVHVLFVSGTHDLFCLGVRAPLVLLASPFEGCSDFVMSMLCLRPLCFLASPYMHARAQKGDPSVCFAHLTPVHVHVRVRAHRSVGFRGCLGKPFSVEGLRQALQLCMGSGASAEGETPSGAASSAPHAQPWSFI